MYIRVRMGGMKNIQLTKPDKDYIILIEKKKKKIQEETYKIMLKKTQRMGHGEKQSDVITVQPCRRDYRNPKSISINSMSFFIRSRKSC